MIKKDGGNNGRALFLCKFIRFAPTDFAINFRDFFFFNDTMDTMDIPFDDLISIQRAMLFAISSCRKKIFISVNEMRSRKQIKFNVKDPFYVK